MRRQIELEPWREQAHRQLMRAVGLMGERVAALVAYGRYTPANDRWGVSCRCGCAIAVLRGTACDRLPIPYPPPHASPPYPSYLHPAVDRFTPRAWGQPHRESTELERLRFTPTSVGTAALDLMGPTERAILIILWRDGPSTVAHLQTQLGGALYNTVVSPLQSLQKEGFVTETGCIWQTVSTRYQKKRCSCSPVSGTSPSWARQRPSAPTWWRRCGVGKGMRRRRLAVVVVCVVLGLALIGTQVAINRVTASGKPRALWRASLPGLGVANRT